MEDFDANDCQSWSLEIVIPFEFGSFRNPWSQSIDQKCIGPFSLSCRLRMIWSPPVISDIQSCQKCIEFAHEMGSIIRRYGHTNSKSEDHLFCQNFVLSSAVAWVISRVSVHFVNASVHVIIHCFLEIVIGKSMIQSKYKRSKGSTTHVGRS